MAFYDLRYFPEPLHYLTEMTGMLKEYTDIGACVKTDKYRIDLEFRAFYNPCLYQSLYTLVNCSP
ncbi:MAG: hypothetical protein MZV63_21710 [Marinilabiliales bacterium]|nr:hypothetical protein [Marinilabiliales bacterium]